MEFMPERSVQDYMLLGGYAGLFFLIPSIIVVYVLGRWIDKLTNRKLSALFETIQKQGPVAIVLSYALLFSLSVAALKPFATLVSSSSQSQKLSVQTVTLSSESKVVTNYRGLCYIAKKGSNYVFADTLSRKGGHLFLLHESEVKEIVFTMAK